MPSPFPGMDPYLESRTLWKRVYDTGAYHRLAHYTGPAEPPLADVDAAWADELLREHGYR